MKSGSTVLDRVERGRLCTGCGACAALSDKVRMGVSPRGFNRPVVTGELDRAEDQKIAEVCPGIGMQSSATTGDDPLWGRMIELRTGHAADPSLRFRAASGGALSAVLVFLVEQGIVDHVLHTAADPSDPISNSTTSSSDPDQIAQAAGSRYAPSSPLESIGEHLASGRRFAFVGKPCDVSALRAMARVDPRVDAQVPVMLSFFCAGVPSRTGAHEILQRLGVKHDEVARFSYRGNGWPGAATARLNDGSEHSMGYDDSWGGVLTRHVQFRCKICPDGIGCDADIAFADAWHTDFAGDPMFKEAEGRSLIITRTRTGEDLLQEAVKAGVLRTNPESRRNIERMQPAQATRKRVLIARLAALVATLQPVPAFRDFRLLRLARQTSVATLVRNFLGTGRRTILGQR